MNGINIALCGTQVWLADQDGWAPLAPGIDWAADWWRDAVIRTPVFANGHSHPLQSLLRYSTIRREANFDQWLGEHVLPFQQRANAATFRAAARVCLAENMLVGNGRVALHCKGVNHPADLEALFDVCETSEIDVHIHLGLYRGVVGRPGTDELIKLGVARAAATRDHVQFGIGPVNLADISIGELREIVDRAKAMNLRLHTHVSETQATAHSLHRLLDEEPDLLRWDLVHCIWEDGEVLRAALDAGGTLITCPLSNAFLSLGMMNVSAYGDGSAIKIGSDGDSSAGSQSVVRAAFAGWLCYGAVANGVRERPTLSRLLDACVRSPSGGGGVPGLDCGNFLEWRACVPLGPPDSLLLEFMSRQEAFVLTDLVLASVSHRDALVRAREFLCAGPTNQPPEGT